MLFKKLKLLVNRKQVFCLSKIILVFLLLLINIATSIQARDSSKKLKDYISQQIQSSQKQKKNIYSILESLEGGIKKSNLLINSIESEIIIIEEDIQKKKASLALVQLELDKILEQVYQKFFLTYLLEKIKLSSFLPNLDYFKNYPRNKKIITLLLTEEILITEEGDFKKLSTQKTTITKIANCNNRLADYSAAFFLAEKGYTGCFRGGQCFGIQASGRNIKGHLAKALRCPQNQ